MNFLVEIPILKEFEWFEWFEWFGPSPIEPFNSGPYRRALPGAPCRAGPGGVCRCARRRPWRRIPFSPASQLVARPSPTPLLLQRGAELTTRCALPRVNLKAAPCLVGWRVCVRVVPHIIWDVSLMSSSSWQFYIHDYILASFIHGFAFCSLKSVK